MQGEKWSSSMIQFETWCMNEWFRARLVQKFITAGTPNK